MPRPPKAHNETQMLASLTQAGAAHLLGISGRSLRDYVDAPRTDAGGYDGRTLVEWWSKRGQRPATMSDDEAESLALLGDDVYSGISEVGAAAMAARLHELHDRHGADFLRELGALVIAQVEAVAKAAQQFPIDLEAQRQAQAQAARQQEAFAQLRIAIVCETCGRLRRGKRWIKAEVPRDHARIGAGCPDCDAK